MRIDRLQIALRPRPAPQALDLGFALLRAHAGTVYKTWLALYLPVAALSGLLIVLLPEYELAWYFLPWWLRPALERGPLYVLSRQVFGEDVTWRQAVRAWPGQLGGGMVRMLTWWRPFMAGRGLYQPIWQLEQARGAAAAARRDAIGRNGTGGAAYAFGLACAHFDAILQFGMLALIGMFAKGDAAGNPLAYLVAEKQGFSVFMLASVAAVTVAASITGPAYIACCFTLYLNRRATLEAWDIEITLRQIQAPAALRQPTQSSQGGHAAPAMLAALAGAALVLLLAGGTLQPATAHAAETITCKRPKDLQDPIGKQLPARGPEQQALRREIQQLYASEDLRGYKCENGWRLKDFDAPPEEVSRKPMDLSLLALVIKAVLISSAVALAAWLLYRYRGRLAWLLPKPTVRSATEIAGMDIRAESLPDDVTGAVRSLWLAGDRRGALALLYRATLSRLVHQNKLLLAQGATEGDCLRLAQHAGLPAQRHAITAMVTGLWLNAAYGNRWPEDAAVTAACAGWATEFDASAATALPLSA